MSREPPQLADFIYDLRCHSPNVEKLSRTKVGRKGVPIVSGGGGSKGISVFNTNIEVNKRAPVSNLKVSDLLRVALGCLSGLRVRIIGTIWFLR